RYGKKTQTIFDEMPHDTAVHLHDRIKHGSDVVPGAPEGISRIFRRDHPHVISGLGQRAGDVLHARVVREAHVLDQDENAWLAGPARRGPLGEYAHLLPSLKFLWRSVPERESRRGPLQSRLREIG